MKPGIMLKPCSFSKRPKASKLIENPAKNFLVFMQNGKILKNLVVKPERC